jgi:hypothetical protein
MHHDAINNNDGRNLLSMGFTRGLLGDVAIGDSSAGIASRSAPSGGLPISTSMVATTTSATTTLVATLATTLATTSVPSGHAADFALPTVATDELLQYPIATRHIRQKMDEAIKSNLNNIASEVVRTQEKHRLKRNGTCFVRELWREHRNLVDVVGDSGMAFREMDDNGRKIHCPVCFQYRDGTGDVAFSVNLRLS